MLLNPQLTILRAQYKLDDLLRDTRRQEAFFVQRYRMMGRSESNSPRFVISRMNTVS